MAKYSKSYLRHRVLRDTLDLFSGFQVNVFNRRPRRPPKCPICQKTILKCPFCSSPIKRTVEKGVDVSIVTDMLQHAWDGTYDAAVLVTADTDFIPAIKFLDTRGKKIIHAGFDPDGAEVAKACWSHINLTQFKDRLSR